MFNYPDPQTVEMLKTQFKAGTKVKLIKMDDTQAPPIGTTGYVKFVDDVGTVHVKWDNGSSLGVVYGEDVISKC